MPPIPSARSTATYGVLVGPGVGVIGVGVSVVGAGVGTPVGAGGGENVGRGVGAGLGRTVGLPAETIGLSVGAGTHAWAA